MDLGEEILRRLLALPGSCPTEFVGATEEEIFELERYAGGPLPKVYKQFLRRLGRSAGRLFRGSDSEVGGRFRLRLREFADALIARHSTEFKLPPTAFVFLMSQGYQFSYFLTDAGDDPAVFHYLVGNQTPSISDDSLAK